MLPKPSKPDATPDPAGADGNDNPRALSAKGQALSDQLRDAFFSKLSNYRREMQPHHARWEQQWQDALRIYAQDFVCSMALHDQVKVESHEYHQHQMCYDARVPAAICCDFMHWRMAGRSAEQIIREFHRRGIDNICERRKRPPAAVLVERSPNAESINRLYGSCYRTLSRDRRPGLMAFPDHFLTASPALQRMGGIRIPPGFLAAYELAEGLGRGDRSRFDQEQLQKNRSHYLSGIGRIVDYLRPDGATLLLVLMERPDNLAEHVLVCDFCEEMPGIFDPDYGFMALPRGAATAEFSTLLAMIAYRYSAQALVAFQDIPE